MKLINFIGKKLLSSLNLGGDMNVNDIKDMTLKTFLRYGTELCDEKFYLIYEEITKHQEKAILIFDGFD